MSPSGSAILRSGDVQAPVRVPALRRKVLTVHGDRQPETYGDLVGAACRRCGHQITDAEVKQIAIETARNLVKKSLG